MILIRKDIMKHFNHLLVEFGTIKQIAYALDVGTAIVYLWKANDRVPVKYLKKINEITEGRVPPWSLRPDLLADFNNPKMYLNPINQQPQEDN
jgi:hypothetical protein